MKGISVYKRAGRPNWYVAYDCPEKLKRVNEATGIPLTDPAGYNKAFDYAKDKSAKFVAYSVKDQERWESWAEDFLRARFANQQKTLVSYLGALKFLLRFFHHANIPIPRAITYQHAQEFVTWRTSQPKRSGRTPGKNTALHNIKVLSRLMREAVRRGYASSNPFYRIGDDIPPDPAKEKRPLTQEDIDLIRASFEARKGKGRPSDWMPRSFEIALHLGCRLSATKIPLNKVDFARWTVTLTEKGTKGEAKIFTLPVHPAIRPLFLEAKREGRAYVSDVPRFASRNFTRFLRSIGLDDVSFHCTRVTVITEFAKQGVPIQQAMAYVSHADQTIHKVYQKLKAADVAGLHSVLSWGGASAKPQTPGASATSGGYPPPSNSGR